MSILASDAMEGRETGKRGQKMAAAFIRANFEELELDGPLDGDYYQTMDLYQRGPAETYVRTETTRYDNFTDIVYYGSDNSGGEVSVPLVFVGNATQVDFDQVDVKDKAVLLFSQSEWIAGNKAVALAKERGARMVFVCNVSDKDVYGVQLGRIKANATNSRLSLKYPTPIEDQRPGLFIVSPRIVDKLLGVTLDKLLEVSDDPKAKSIKKIKPVLISYKTSMTVKVIKSENVLGFLEGKDKKNELLIISSHYDHIGIKQSGTGDLINNGADDDGSGTVAVIELAKVFALAKKEGYGPRRSILFMTFTGEESGLLGSEFYTEHPVFPLGETVVELNIDMVGRRDALHQESAPYIYVIGADQLSSELNVISESVNKAHTNLIFDYTYNDQRHPERLYYRSDHWNFAKNNIPIIFYFDGIHEDYHKPSDEIEKIEFDLLTERTKCIFFMAWEIANREARIMPDIK